ncbi:MAG: hypothetical protein PHG65_03380 [Kiritimatiellae bacterium]|nr:hypothetical protein [Kiritimatiellia bacterium]
MINALKTGYEGLMSHLQANTGEILLWMLLFLLILTLFVIHLMRRISLESSKRAIEMAEKSQRKSEEIGRRIDDLNRYLRDVFRKEFGGAMDSFDANVNAVLTEMKNELTQSVNNIERIESAVRSRKKINLQVEEGRDKAQAMLNQPDAKKRNPEPPIL